MEMAAKLLQQRQSRYYTMRTRPEHTASVFTHNDGNDIDKSGGICGTFIW